jgi:hypothetical protein
MPERIASNTLGSLKIWTATHWLSELGREFSVKPETRILATAPGGTS